MAKSKKKIAKKTHSKKIVSKKPVRKSVRKSGAKKPVAAKKKIVAKPLKKNAPAKAKKTAPVKKRPSGIPEQLRDAALKILDERQAEEVVCFDLAGRSSVADYLIVASGRAARQLGAIAHYIGEAFEKLGAGRLRVEGLPEANWVLVDGGDVIVHLFRPEVRGYYKIEDIYRRK